MMRRIIVLPLLLFFLAQLFSGCGLWVKGPSKHQLKRWFKQSAVANGHFTGFALWDLDRKCMVYTLHADKYFTPASNTKLFTFYTCLRTLPKRLPALRYVLRGDSLIFWSTGYPCLLHPNLPDSATLGFLRQQGKKLFFAQGLYQGEFYGSGWQYDDYNEDYQPEISELPLYGNTLQLNADAAGHLRLSPHSFAAALKADSAFKPTRFTVRRNLLNNTFYYPVGTPLPAKYQQQVPFKYSAALAARLLADTLHQPVGIIAMPLPANALTLPGLPADTVYRHLLQPSDNFLAEQLLLQCSALKFGVLNTDSIINYAEKHYLADLPDKPQWVDGSGLSRMNLFTPRDMVALLLKIREAVGDDALLHSLLPAGGQSGTLKYAYSLDAGQPFVWAKTGSLSNNHNQSGYFTTRKGRHFAYSFMNNNFTQPSRQIRAEMVKLITMLHEVY